MKSDDTLHPCNEIPGGLWVGAVVSLAGLEDDELADVVTALWGNGSVGLVGYIDGFDDICNRNPADLCLLLPGPLGLGLAGLAARVAERCGRLERCPGKVANWLTGRGEQPPPWFPGRQRPHHPVVTAASYLALTDRLAGAVGLELQPGEVAAMDWGGNGSLCLCAHDGQAMLAALATIDPTDWLGALRACVAEVTRG